MQEDKQYWNGIVFICSSRTLLKFSVIVDLWDVFQAPGLVLWLSNHSSWEEAEMAGGHSAGMEGIAML